MSAIYQCDPYEDLNNETFVDLSSKSLHKFPEIDYVTITAIYLQNNNIKAIPDDLFPNTPNLVWLDLRYNEIESIPASIKGHTSLSHLLLQSNKLTSLPDELGTVMPLKVLQLSGNPLIYPPKQILNAGTSEILTFLYNNFIDKLNTHCESQSTIVSESDRGGEVSEVVCNEARSYNSVLDGNELKKMGKPFCVKFDDREDEFYDRLKGKCPKLAVTRHKTFATYSQSSKYLKRIRTPNKDVQDQKILQSHLKDIAIKKKKEFLLRAEKIIQHKKNVELLRDWRKNYKNKQLFMSRDGKNYKDLINYPYNTNAEYMTFLLREDITKDLPDKYRKKLVRKCKPSVPRKSSNDIHLAMKIKKLFENLEEIDLNKGEMTPRTEQKILLNEIQKISEIKQKLAELSLSNARLVLED